MVLDWTCVVETEWFYDPAAAGDPALEVFSHPNHHATQIDAFTASDGDTRFSALWMCDDDNAYASLVQRFLDANELENFVAEFLPGFRPISIAASVRPPLEGEGPAFEPYQWRVEYACVTLRDLPSADYFDPQPWAGAEAPIDDFQVVPNLPWDQMHDLIVNMSAEGYRPISLKGVGVPTSNNNWQLQPTIIDITPRFSAIFVRDNIPVTGWRFGAELTQQDFWDEFDVNWVDGFRPICFTGYQSHFGDTRFGFVMVKDTSGPFGGPNFDADWTILSGLERATFEIENQNQREKGFQLVVFTSYPASAPLELPKVGDVRYVGIWRRYEPRRMTMADDAFAATQVEAVAFVDLLPALMQSSNVSAGSIAIAKGSELLFSAAYTNAPAGMQATTRLSPFRVASVAKSITSLGVFAAIEDARIAEMKDGTEGPLSLDDLVFEVDGVPDLPDVITNPEQTRVRDFLRQNSRWFTPELGDGIDLSGSDPTIAQKVGHPLPIAKPQMVQYLQDPSLWPVADPPDTASIGFWPPMGPVDTYPWRYANMNYISLEWLLEAIVHEDTYQGYLQKRILSPSNAGGMRRARTERVLTAPAEPVYQVGNVTYRNDVDLPLPDADVALAVGVNTNGADFYQHAWRPTGPYGARFNLERNFGDGGWLATADELVAIMATFREWNGAGGGASGMIEPDGSKVLAGATVDAMLLDGPLNPEGGGVAGEQFDPEQENLFPAGSFYVNGWWTREGTFGGAGSASGMTAMMARRPDGVSWAVVLSRAVSIQAIYDALTAAIDEAGA